MPEEAILASMTIDNVKIEKLVQEFLDMQSLKILPQAPFGDAVTQFVDKDDKHIESAMERYRTQKERQFESGVRKRPRKKGKMKPRPDDWDSDMQGEWEDAAEAYEYVEEDETPAPPVRRNRAAPISDDDSDGATPVPAKKAPAKRAPVKKAPPKKAPAKAPARGKKKAATPSDDDEDDDVIMLDDDEPQPPPKAKAQPRRAAAAKPAARQTQLNFSQATQGRSQANELSDDEISDDDAFEPMVSSNRRR
jgi:double-strand break repair protein MRE11